MLPLRYNNPVGTLAAEYERIEINGRVEHTGLYKPSIRAIRIINCRGERVTVGRSDPLSLTQLEKV
jgi:hypothetical protein